MKLSHLKERFAKERKEVAAVVVIGVLDMIANIWAAEHGYARYASVISLLVSLLVIAYISHVLFSVLKHKLEHDGPQAASYMVASTKLEAEILAGVALLAFAITFFRAGYDVDSRNTDARFNHFMAGSHLIGTQLTKEYCYGDKQLPWRASTCSEIFKGIQKIEWEIVDGDEKSLHRDVFAVTYALKTEIALDPGVQDKAPIVRAVDELDDTEVGDSWTAGYLDIFQMFFFFAAGLAVARKVAVAKFDKFRANPITDAPAPTVIDRGTPPKNDKINSSGVV